ncbi:MAG TPA: zinc-dependent alcohol dehydrogenase family protein [Frankiaceae bacterium]|nr:zinc-dependent alcohol dehydrogenase family protein [Frankiaceae bacterium]
MRAWIVERPRPVREEPLRLVDLPDPQPGPGEIRVRVSTCGVCRTDLHVVEGDLLPHRQPVVPGHEIVGVVDRCGPAASRFRIGERVGIAWLRSTCGVCRFCRRDMENLCLDPRFTGWDEHGGYAELAVVNESYAYAVPDTFPDLTAAPLLCAGIIGYRALRRAEVPSGGGLGLWGFGGSAHLTAQIAMAQGAEVHVRTRGQKGRELAAELGASSVGDSADPLPAPLDAAILFAPVGDLVPVAMSALDRGGTLAVAGIHLSDIPTLNYQQHLFQERTLRSVTANTRADGTAFLEAAARVPVRVSAVPYPFERAPKALLDLAEDRVRGAAVLTFGA